MRPPRSAQAQTVRRPAEPTRPLPARNLGASLLGLKARRRRLRRRNLPPGAGRLDRW